MKKVILILCFFTLYSLPLISQNWVQVNENKSLYIIGEGFGETVEEADKQALTNLVKQISANSINDFVLTEEEKKKIDAESYPKYIESKIGTYATTTLLNTNYLIIKNEPDAHVGRWIPKDKLDMIYADRKAKIMEYIGNAVAAEKDAKIDVALRNFYWAYSLLKTIPHSAEIMYKDSENIDQSVIVWIPNKMNEVFDNIKPSVVNSEGKQLELYFTYKGHPISSLDYTYFDGVRWSNIYSANGGKGVLELADGAKSEDLQLKYEYAHKSEARIDREVEAVLNIVVGTSMRKSYATLKCEIDSETAKAAQKFEKEEMEQTYANIRTFEDSDIEAAMNRVITSIKNKDYTSVKDLFTTDGMTMYLRLMQYGNGSILGTPSFKILEQNGNKVVRSIPMSFSCPGNVRKSFVENVVFTFVEGKIDCIAFSLDDIAVKDILNNDAWSPTAKMVIIEFLENYKTAFALERLDYIETIFDDEAVIITGKMVKKAKSYVNEGISFGGFTEEEFVRTRMTKGQYIKHLKMTFDSKEFINIRFSSNTVQKAGGNTEVYGLQIKQDYFSNNYGDTGYLFLLVDINNPKEPTIRIRTWQPKPDYSVDQEDGLYDMYNF